MKWHQLAPMWVLTGTLALGQQPIKGSTGSGPVGSAPTGSTDSGATGSLRVKSAGQIFQENPQLAEKMKALLPSDVAPEQACSGYKAFDQCLSAIHLAKDVNIPFSALKTETTGKHASGLEKAAEHLAPAANAKEAVKGARKAAAEDMRGISLFG
jgi:hypothetical protein